MDKWLGGYMKQQEELEELEKMRKNNVREHESEVKGAIEAFRMEAVTKGGCGDSQK
jgi:hypothetical protein